MIGIGSVLSFITMASLTLAASTMNQEKVPVTVYYESLCRDSIKFYTTQLYPTWVNLSNYMNLTLIPFGKATYNKTDSGQLEFSCHHGELECVGNKVQACALKVLPQMSEQVSFINCLMSMSSDLINKSTTYPGSQCAGSVGVDYKLIETCTSSTQSAVYLAELGDKTMDLNPKLKFVPTVVFNNKYSEDDDNMARTNFKAALCNHISGMKPAECMSSNNSAIAINAGFAPIIAMSTFVLTRLY